MTLNSVKKQASQIVRDYDDGHLSFESMTGQLADLFVEVFEFGYKQGHETGKAAGYAQRMEEGEGEIEFEPDMDLDELREDEDLYDPGENGEEQ